MGEAKRRMAGNGAGGNDGGGRDMTIDDMIKNAAEDMTKRICPLPLMNYRPPHLDIVGDAKVPIPSLPCLRGQCMMYSESLVRTMNGFQKVGTCGLGAAGLMLNQNVAPAIESLGKTFAVALAEVLVAHDEAFATRLVELVADAIYEDDDVSDEPGVQPAAAISLEALIPKKE